MIKVLSWNVAGRVRKYPLQHNSVLKRDADIIAIQEIIKTTHPKWSTDLENVGYAVRGSFDFVDDENILQRGRKYGVIIASKWDFETIEPGVVPVPWPERLLSIRIDSPWGEIEFHTVHMPAGVNQGIKKPETFEGLHTYLANKDDGLRILCGDFNSPRREYQDGEVLTWGKTKRRSDGRLINKSDNRWARAEQGVFSGLEEYGMKDVYRMVNGYEKYAYSWVHHWRDKRTERRFDHIFATPRLNPIECRYLYDFLEKGLSDHAPIEAIFNPI